MNVVDLFAGPGGWDVAARELGMDPLGIEWDDAACKTREAAGLRTEQADVSKLEPSAFGPVDLLIASPPCQDFSLAGKRAGIDGDRGQLVREVLRWADALRPTFVACEQVPPVLEIWQHYAHVFRGWGYSAWTGILNAADYGVPQTRQRAILIARRDGNPAHPPEPTHCRGGAPESMFGPGLKPWVSMAQALGWGMTDRPWFTFAPGTAQGGMDPVGGSGARKSLQSRRDSAAWVEKYGERENRTEDEPAPTMTGEAFRWTVRSSMGTPQVDGRNGTHEFDPFGRPAHVITGKSGEWTLHTNRDQQPDGTRQTIAGDRPAPSFTAKSGGQWVYERPATTVQGDPRIGRPGHKDRDKGEAQFEQGAVRITVAEAAALQSFPSDHPWQGSRTKQFEQIGNAIPPRLARHILAALVGDARDVAA